MTWTWTNTNNQGEDITPEWGTEVKNAIARLMADIYSAPTNDNTASGKFEKPLQTLAPVANGILICNAGTPVIVTVSVGDSVLRDDWVVLTSWQEGFDPEDGDLRLVKSISNGVLTISFTNTGGTTGKRFAYVVFRRVWQ